LPRQKGRQVSPCGPDPRRSDDHDGSPSFGVRTLIGDQTSKAPPRNPGGIPSGIPSGRTDGTWDPPIHGRNVPGRFAVWNGFLWAIHLPSFPFPGRDSNRRIIWIEGTFHGDLSSSEEREPRKPIGKETWTLPPCASPGMQRNEQKGSSWENRRTTFPRSPWEHPA
jgi:hypothetical protein